MSLSYNHGTVPALDRTRIVVTRTRSQASALAAQLEALGATAILIPTIEIVAPASYAPLDAALARIEDFDWLIFTSANAVEVFHERRSRSGGRTRDPGRIAAIGPATARAVQGVGLGVDLIAPQSVAESLGRALMPHAPNARMLLVRATEARDVLPNALTAGGAQVTIVDAYRNQVPPGSVAALERLFGDAETWPDAVTFTSASTARNLFSLLEAARVTLPETVVRASIGPVTSQALRDLGYPPHIEATEPSIPALVQALVAHFGL